jgi:hypothetical protein
VWLKGSYVFISMPSLRSCRVLGERIGGTDLFDCHGADAVSVLPLTPAKSLESPPGSAITGTLAVFSAERWPAPGRPRVAALRRQDRRPEPCVGVRAFDPSENSKDLG